MKENRCLNCAAPLGVATSTFLRCPFCQSEFYLPPQAGFRIPEPCDYPHPPGLGTITVGDHQFRVHGRLAQGRHSEVFLARRERALTELVVLKVAQHGLDAESGVRREWEALGKIRALHEFLAHLNPHPVVLGLATCSGRSQRLAAVYRWRSGFSFTFKDAREQYPQGVDPRAAVWMWNRILEQLTVLHSVGYSHNALQPVHLLLHPRDHGVAFCGWSQAARGPGDDLRDSGRSVATLLGPLAPKALLQLTAQAADYANAAALKQELKTVSQSLFGPPQFTSFHLQTKVNNR